MGELNLNIEYCFSESCLPLLSELTAMNANAILSHLTHIEPGWSFFDRVLAWIIPSFYDQIAAFYSGQGDQMIKLYTKEQLIFYDDAASRFIRRKLGIASAVDPISHGRDLPQRTGADSGSTKLGAER